MSNRRLRTVLGLEFVVLLMLLTLAFDQYVHAQVEMKDGLNRWGYRGAVAKRRVYDETRIMMIGGSRAFEPGIPVEQTALARVRFRVQEWVTHDRGPVTAVNLGLVDLPRGAFAARLDHFRYLEPDVICVYAELARARTSPSPSLTMRITGYLPAAGALAAIDRGLGRMFAAAPATDDIDDVADAVAVSLTMAPTVVILPQPGSDDEERSRKALLASFDRFAGEARLKLVRLTDEAAIGDQIEPAVSEFLRLRKAPAAAR
jgi:hypothetical protein